MDHLVPETTGAAEPAEGVRIAYMTSGDRVSAQHFEIEPGAVVPEHDHHHEQLGFVYEGELRFFFDGTELDVAAGEGFFIPGGEPHAAENVGDTVVRGIDVFAPARSADYWSE